MKHLVLAFALLAACGKSSKSSEQKPALDAATKVATIDAAAATPADGPATMTVTPAGAIDVGKPVKLTVELIDAAGTRIPKLEIVHEKLLHLIVVSKGLAEFAHIHPEQQPDGTLVVEHTFPAPGTYLLYGDFKPEGGAQTVARASIEVPGTAPAAAALTAVSLPATAKEAGYEVTLSTDAPTASPGSAGARSTASAVRSTIGVGETVLKFAVKQKGKDVTDLQPYLGARGHCVILSDDGAHYLHSHPLTDSTPDVQFHTTFEAAGVYKLWAEFRPNGDPLRVSFVIEVKDGAVAVTEVDAGVADDHDHHTPKPAPDAGAAEPPAPPDAAPPKDPGDKKLAAAEKSTWAKAKPVFEKHCAECHTAAGAKTSARKLAKLDIDHYPFTGSKSSTEHMRKVLGINGGKATMPKGNVGAVQGDELAAIQAWCDAYDDAHPAP